MRNQQSLSTSEHTVGRKSDARKLHSHLIVRSVLPHGLDAVLEHVVIGAELQVVGSLNMVVGAPEVFHLFV